MVNTVLLLVCATLTFGSILDTTDKHTGHTIQTIPALTRASTRDGIRVFYNLEGLDLTKESKLYLINTVVDRAQRIL
jgi:hypothetical protein